MNKERRSTQPPLVGALSHTRRSVILRYLGEIHPASATQIARGLDLPPSTVAEEVRWLRAEGLIEESGRRERRGAVERLFRPKDGTQWMSDDEWEVLSADHRKMLILDLVRSMLARLAAASAAGVEDVFSDSSWASSVYSLDAEGWSELSQIHRRLVADAERVAKESRERMAGSPEPALRACSSSFLFAMPRGAAEKE